MCRNRKMNEELTKKGSPVSAKTFGSLICRDNTCRHAAVDIGLFDIDLRLYGRYMHFNGYKTIKEAREILNKFAKNKSEPFSSLKPKNGKVVNFNEWKNKKHSTKK